MLGFFAAMALCAPSASLAADAIYGVWVRDGHPTDKLEFYDCSGKLCAKGTLPGVDGSPPPIILRSAAKTGPNNWKGDLFNPEDGKTYTGKISYDSPTQMTMTGCLVAFLCQSETWTRVSGPPKPKAEAKPEAKAEDKDVEKGAEKAVDKAPGKTGADAPAKPAKPAKAAETKSPEAKSAEAKSPEGKSSETKPATAKPAPRVRPKPVEEEAN
jgi:uncharacterized protein (DUF2147 family)